MTLQAPKDTQRLLITGRTGSGKSQFAMHVLSGMNFHQMPYVFIDYKGEPLFEEIMENNPSIKTLKVTDNPPKKPGLYYLHPMPVVDDKAIDAFLWKVYHQGHCGLVIDEGYCLPQARSNCFDVLCVQGRTKHIPLIYLYQRSNWMSRFAVAQSDFRAFFEQDDTRDQIIAKSFIRPCVLPDGTTIDTLSPLPKYYCLWYDVGQGKTSLLRPAPARETIIETFNRRLFRHNKRVLV